MRLTILQLLSRIDALTNRVRQLVTGDERMQEIITDQQTHIDALNTLNAELRSMYPPEPEPGPEPGNVVRTTEELLAALADGGDIELAAGVEFYNPGGFNIGSDTHITAPGLATIRADNAPALRVRPGVTDVTVRDVSCTCAYNGAVIQLGDNSADSQGTPEDVPRRITLERITIPTHRGKRGIEVNAADVDIFECTITDIWKGDQDNQAIAIINSPGPVMIDGGRYSAGSENIMLGGDSMKVPGQVISDVTIRNCHIYKPLSWQKDGVSRQVKNLIEIKAGRNVLIENCTLDGCWKASQDGYAIVITPKNAQFIETVVIEGCEITNVAAGLQLMGRDYNTVTPQDTSGLRVVDCTFAVSKALYGGRGILALTVDGMLDSTFERIRFTGDGNCIVQADSKILQGPMFLRDCDLQYLQYGVMMPGSNYGDPIPPDSDYYPRRLIIDFQSNRFTGSVHSKFKTNYPSNTYPAASRTPTPIEEL